MSIPAGGSRDDIDRVEWLASPVHEITNTQRASGVAFQAGNLDEDKRSQHGHQQALGDVDRERAATLAAIGLLGIGLNATALILAPILRPDVNLLRDGLSHYAVGPWGSVQSAAFIALGIGSLTLSWALWLVSDGNLWARIAAVMLGLASFNFVGLAVFPMGEGGPMTPIGDLHLTVATFAVGWQFLSVGALLLGLRAWPHESHTVRLGIALVGISLLGAASVQVAMWRPDLRIPEGLAMRCVIVPLLLWWVLIAMAIRRRAAN